MKTARINYVAVGAFVILMAAVLVVAIAVVSGRRGAVDEYHAVFTDVSGLERGADVRFDGYTIGRVTDITPRRRDGEMVFRVDLAIDEGWPMPADSVARTASSGPLSAVAVRIEGGERDELLEPGSAIAGKPSVDLFAKLTEVAEQVPALMADLRAISAELRTHTPELMDSARAVTGNLEAGSRELRRALSANNRQKVSSALSNLEDASQGAATLADQLQQTRGRLDTLIGDLSSAVDESRPSIATNLRHLERTLARVARSIDTIVHDLEGTGRNMKEFSRRIRDNPGLLLRGAERPPAAPAREEQ